MKRIISTILTVSMLFTMAPAFASDVETSDVNNTMQLFSVGAGEAVVKKSAKQFDVITADFEDKEAGEISFASAKTVYGENYLIYSVPNGGTEAHFIEQEADGNQVITLTNEAGGYTGNSSTNVQYVMAKGNKVNLTYRLRFNKPNEDWTSINISSDAGVMSGSYADGNTFGFNYGGDYANNTAASAKYKSAVNGVFSIETGVWYTLNYVFDLSKQTYDFAVTSDKGDVTIKLTTKDGSDPLKDIPFRVAKTATKVDKMYLYVPHDSTDASKTSANSLSLDDVQSYAVEEGLFFNLIGPETLSDAVDMRLEYSNTTSDDKDVCVTYVAYEDGIVVDTDEVTGTLSRDGSVLEAPVSVDTSACTGVVTYDAFVTDAATGATLSIDGSKESSSAPADFVTAEEANGKISVKVAKDAAYDAAVIRVYDEDENLVGIKEQKITNSAITFNVADYNKEYKVDVTLSDAAGNAAFGKAYVTVWDPAIAEDFNTDPESAFATHMDALDKAYGGDFASIYEANSDYINNYVMLRDDYTSVYDVIDTVLSLEGFLAVIASADETEFAYNVENNADSLGVILDDTYFDNKDAIIATLFAAKDDFILPEDFVVAYNDAYITAEFNAAVAISYSRLFEKYKGILGITVDSQYYAGEATINNLIYEYKLELENGRFAEADDVAKAYRNAKNNAIDAVGYATVATSPVSKNEVVLDFDNNNTGYTVNIKAGQEAFGSYEIVTDDDNNNYLAMKQLAGGEDAVQFKLDNLPKEGIINVSERIKFEQFDTGYVFLRIMGAYLYAENNKWGINYGGGKMITTGTKELIQADMWYDINFVLDCTDSNNRTFEAVITDENGTVVFEDSGDFRTAEVGSLIICTPHKDGTNADGTNKVTTEDTIICVDDISVSTESAPAVYYSAKASENIIEGSNGIAVAIENLTGTDRNIKVYVPVYVDGVLYTVANEQAYFADGSDDEILVTYEIGEDVDVSKVTYDVIVADSLDGTSHSVVSAKDSGTVEVDASADYEAEVINVSVKNTFDNGAIIVLKPGATISSADMSDILYYAEGNTAAVKVADGISGDLKVYAVAQNADGIVTKDSADVYYPGNGTAKALLEAFNGATAETITGVVADYITVINNIEEGMNSFYVANAAAVDAALVENKPYTSIEQVINTMKSVKALAALKAATSETEFEAAFGEFADMFDVEFDSIYTDNKADFITKMYAVKDTLNTYADVMAAYNAIYMIHDINTATEDTIAAKLAQYAAALGIELDEVYTSKQLYIDRLIAADVPFADAAAIVSSYNNAYAKAEAIEGEFVKTVVSASENQIQKDIINFENEDVKSGNGNYTAKDGTFSLADASLGGSYYIEEKDGNKYLRFTAPATTKRAMTLNVPTKNFGDKVQISTKFKANKLSNWILFYIGSNQSCLNLQGGKFLENRGKETAPSLDSKTITTDVWYTITWNMDLTTYKYDLYIVNSNNPGDVIVDKKDIPFRENKSTTQIVFTTSSENSTESDVVFDDITRIANPTDGFYYTVDAINTLLPGENTFDMSFTNANSDKENVAVYVPVYANGKLISCDKLYSDEIASGASVEISKNVNVSADLINAGADVDYEVFVVKSLDGVNYGVASKAVLPRTTTLAAPVADYATETIKVSGTTTYDNMSILVTGPVADGRDYDIEAAKTDASVIAYYAPAKLTAISSVTDNATQEKITTSSFAVDVKVPDKFVNGDYNIYFVSQNKAGEVQTSYAYTYYAGNDMLDDMLTDFNALTEGNVEATVNKYMEVLEGVAADAATFYANNKAAVNTALLAETGFANVGEINSVIFAIYAIDELATASDVASFKSTFEYYANVFAIDTAIAEYAEGAAEINERLFADKANLTIDNINDKYATALMLSEFNNAERGEVDAVLTKYSTKLGLSVSTATYNTYKDYIAKAIAADGVIFNSAADIVAAYNNGITDGENGGVNAPQPAGPTGSSNGGGGGGGGAITANVAQPYVEPETSLDSAAASAFTDLDTVPWAVEAITELKRIGVISGVSDTQFAPDRAVTREEFAKMIVNAFSISGEGKSFTDVPATAWYAPYVTALASSGIVNGVTDTTFGVGTKISRQDAAVMLDRTSAKVGIEYEFDTSALNIFSDYMADYARISIYRLYQNGVINGTSATTFCATDTLTRAQAAKMIYGLMQLK